MALYLGAYLEKGLASFLESNYFRMCRLYSLCCNHTTFCDITKIALGNIQKDDKLSQWKLLLCGLGDASIDDARFVSNEDLNWTPRIQIKKPGDLTVPELGIQSRKILQLTNQPALATGCTPLSALQNKYAASGEWYSCWPLSSTCIHVCGYSPLPKSCNLSVKKDGGSRHGSWALVYHPLIKFNFLFYTWANRPTVG